MTAAFPNSSETTGGPGSGAVVAPGVAAALGVPVEVVEYWIEDGIDVAAFVAALADHPLPAGVSDATMNLEELASAMGVSVNTTSKWAKSGMPLLQEGRAGRAYEVRLSHAFAWHNWAKAAEAARKSEANGAAAAMQAALFNLADGPVLTHKDRKEVAQADIEWSRAKRERRQLVPLQEVVDLMGDIMTIVREGIETLPDRLERELGLNPDQVKRAIIAGRDTLDECATRIEEAHLRERELGEADFEGQLTF